MSATRMKHGASADDVTATLYRCHSTASSGTPSHLGSGGGTSGSRFRDYESELLAARKEIRRLMRDKRNILEENDQLKGTQARLKERLTRHKIKEDQLERDYRRDKSTAKRRINELMNGRRDSWSQLSSSHASDYDLPRVQSTKSDVSFAPSPMRLAFNIHALSLGSGSRLLESPESVAGSVFGFDPLMEYNGLMNEQLLEETRQFSAETDPEILDLLRQAYGDTALVSFDLHELLNRRVIPSVLATPTFADSMPSKKSRRVKQMPLDGYDTDPTPSPKTTKKRDRPVLTLDDKSLKPETPEGGYDSPRSVMSVSSTPLGFSAGWRIAESPRDAGLNRGSATPFVADEQLVLFETIEGSLSRMKELRMQVTRLKRELSWKCNEVSDWRHLTEHQSRECNRLMHAADAAMSKQWRMMDRLSQSNGLLQDSVTDLVKRISVLKDSMTQLKDEVSRVGQASKEGVSVDSSEAEKDRESLSHKVDLLEREIEVMRVLKESVDEEVLMSEMQTRVLEDETDRLKRELRQLRSANQLLAQRLQSGCSGCGLTCMSKVKEKEWDLMMPEHRPEKGSRKGR